MKISAPPRFAPALKRQVARHTGPIGGLLDLRFKYTSHLDTNISKTIKRARKTPLIAPSLALSSNHLTKSKDTQ